MNIYEHAGECAVTEPKICFSANKILGERDFDNPSNRNVDSTFSLLSIVLMSAKVGGFKVSI